MTSDDQIEFEVPTPSGRCVVRVPADMSAADAEIAARRISAVIRAMFAVVDSEPLHLPEFTR